MDQKLNDIEWNVWNEGQLLDAMVGHKPVGINKYFQMAFICNKFCESINKEVDSDKIWQHLGTMYNLEALDEIESIPFPNNEKEFSLPEDEFAALISKMEEERKSIQKGRDTPKSKETRKEKEDKTPVRNLKETPRRDSKDNRETNKTPLAKKEIKKQDAEKSKGGSAKTRMSTTSSRDDVKQNKNKNDETPIQPIKRSTRGSLKPDDGTSSPINSPTPSRRRRAV